MLSKSSIVRRKEDKIYNKVRVPCVVCKSSRSRVQRGRELQAKATGDSEEVFSMGGMVLEVGVPVTVPNIEITCHDNHTFQTDDILTQEM